MRILGLDYGSKTVGVAVSDPLLLTAQGVGIIRRDRESKLRHTLARIQELTEKYGVERIVVGYPLHMNDEVGERARKSEEFADLVRRRTGLPVILWDERLTTVRALETMDELGIRDRERRKALVDEIAAVFILQSYLDEEYGRRPGRH